MFHGLAAYMGGNKPLQILKKADGIVGNEICCSDKAIGPVGVYCSGSVIRAFSKDCWSWIDENGCRQTDRFVDGVRDAFYNTDGYKYQVNDLMCNDWVSELKKAIYEEGDSYRYSEIFMIPDSIDAVWIKAKAKEKFKKTARVLARKLGVPVVVVTNDSDALNWG